MTEPAHRTMHGRLNNAPPDVWSAETVAGIIGQRARMLANPFDLTSVIGWCTVVDATLNGDCIDLTLDATLKDEGIHFPDPVDVASGYIRVDADRVALHVIMPWTVLP